MIIEHTKSKGNTKVGGLQTLVGQPKIPNDYEELNKSFQEWYLQRTSKRPNEGSSESSDKKVKVNVIKGTDHPERTRYEDIQEAGYKIGSQGAAFNASKTRRLMRLTKTKKDF